MLTQEQLSNMTCSTPGCQCNGTLWFRSKCHPNIPCWVRYHHDGFLTVFCAECDREIVSTAIYLDEAGGCYHIEWGHELGPLLDYTTVERWARALDGEKYKGRTLGRLTCILNGPARGELQPVDTATAQT